MALDIENLNEKMKDAQGTEKVDLLGALANLALEQNDLDQAREYARQALDLARESGYDSGIGQAYYQLGKIAQSQEENELALQMFEQAFPLPKQIGDTVTLANIEYGRGAIYLALGQFANSMEFFKKAIVLHEKLGNKASLARAYNNMGIIFTRLGDASRALAYHLDSLKIKQELGDQNGIAASYMNMGLLCINQDEPERAFSYYQKALAIFEELNNRYGMGKVYINLGNNFNHPDNDLQKALAYYGKAVPILLETDNQRDLAMVYICIGNNYHHQGQNEQSKQYYHKSLDILEKFNDQWSLIYPYTELGEAALDENDLSTAERYLHKALDISRKIGSKAEELSVLKYLIKLARMREDWTLALTYYDECYDLRETLFNENKAREINKLNTIYEVETKEKELELFRLKNVELVNKNLKIFKQKEELESQAADLNQAYQELELSHIQMENTTRELVREKAQSDLLLVNILPRQIAEELKAKGRTTPRHYDQVTILFTDFVGFTHLAEVAPPEQLVQDLDTCFAAFDEIVEKHRVEKIKTIGDAFMAVAGIPVSNQTHAEDAIQAALAMQQWISGWNAQREQQGKPAWLLRIGIHSGSVVAGVVGKRKFAYDIWGDSVNLASRIESSSEPGKINISGATYALVKEKFECEYRGKVAAKNKGEVDMYFVTNHKAAQHI